jgi:hypothetical protein
MSRLGKSLSLIGAFVICFFAGGAILWRGSYEQYLHRSFPWEMLPLLGGAALILSWAIGTGIVASAIIVAAAFPAIIFARVVIDTMDHPTRHNLWPFELLITFVGGMIMTFPFAAIGMLLHRVTHRGRS